MNALQLQNFLHQSVPLSLAMGLSVLHLSEEKLVLAAPFEPNRNQHGTVFGGSSTTLCTLAAWGLVYSRLESSGLKTKLVAKSSKVHYLAPLSCAFEAKAELLDPLLWEQFLSTLQTEGKARITLQASAYDSTNPENIGTALTGEFSAHIVA
jgi:thioesterase domain-containing protein